MKRQDRYALIIGLMHRNGGQTHMLDTLVSHNYARATNEELTLVKAQDFMFYRCQQLKADLLAMYKDGLLQRKLMPFSSDIAGAPRSFFVYTVSKYIAYQLG